MVPLPRRFLFVFAGLLLVTAAWAEVTVTRPFAGITLVKRTETAPRAITMHVALIDLATPGLAFKLSAPAGARDTVRQTTLEFLKQEKAQLAVNVHFFVPYPTPDKEVDVVGLAVSEGVVYSGFEPQPVGLAYPDQSFAIVPYAPAMNIDRANHVTFITRREVTVDRTGARRSEPLWNAFSGSAQIVTAGVKTIPSYTNAPGGLKDSKSFTTARSWYDIPRARTAAGLTADAKTLVLFTGDQAAGSAGMTVGEVAEVLIREFQVTNALNLDGGGSTALAMEDLATHTARLVNVPSDGPNGRAVGSSLAVFVRR
jgi:hypothetical protein